ncbi:hypothetical protein BTO32_15270 [Marinobacter lutaoensis]|uniref:Uncharacterized protein n=1 Tax=Marinobacter lutaoensis TaxID=135739 RepID=A0A1V2DQ84_9GAMM|nr:DotG/IcmE/VirB10 family protein [Marinobacter lutaoensis]ONF42566.1 hypothetical protein BTO32_15270 [Marinobacter lutaoensis]
MSETKQSAFQYLRSKEGRPAFIGVLISAVLVPVIFFYAFEYLYGDDAQPREVTEEQRQAAGSSAVNATGKKAEGKLTSPDLTPEARAALEEYNRKAYEEGRMGQPTPDDVVYIDVDENGLPVDRQKESQASDVAPEQNPESENTMPDLPGNDSASALTIGRPDPGVRRTVGENGIDTRMDGLTREQQEQRLNMTPDRLKLALAEHKEYRTRRMDAAVQLIDTMGQPPAIASLSFARDKGEGRLPEPARVERVGGNTGNGDTRFVESEKSGSHGGVCTYPLVKGGEIRYAVSDIALNTDFQGPVRVTFLDGNLAQYIGLGSFELNELGARMKLKIERIFDLDGNSYNVSGYVLDPETTLWALASDVDYHIIYRYGGFGLGTIMSAFQVLAENRATVTEVTNPDGGTVTQNRDPDGKQITWTMIGEFSELFEEAFRDNINRPITVTLDPNEEVAVLFEDTVCELESAAKKRLEARDFRYSKGIGDPISSSRFQ